jgi:cellulose biosynthesis protein BcsQ
MSKEPIYVSFATQKGGAGKTPFTVLAASWLHYKLGYNVAVIDCDFPQHSLAGIRKRDLGCMAKNDYYKKLAMEQFQAISKKFYPVVSCDVQRALRWATSGAEEVIDAGIAAMGFAGNLDVVFFDLPGTVNQSEVDAATGKRRGVLSLVACMDCIFCPMRADRTAVDSALMFINEVQANIVERKVGALRQFHLFWTEVDGRERTRVYDVVGKTAEKYGFPMLETRIPYMLRFKKEGLDTYDIFKSTLFPAKPSLAKEARMDAFMEEVCKSINLK